MHENSVLLVDKPLGWTSFQVVKTLQRGLSLRKVGHAGTLDPLASGLLILCTNDKTKEIAHYQALDKVYVGVMELGKTTPSFDLETDFNGGGSYDGMTLDHLMTTRKLFEGEISQVPPIYSAIRKNGQRAYKRARKNKEVVLDPRRVWVKYFVFTKIELPFIHFKVHCGKGVYIRSIVHDFGQTLGCGAYLYALQRTQIGNYTLEEAQTVHQILSCVHKEETC